MLSLGSLIISMGRIGFLKNISSNGVNFVDSCFGVLYAYMHVSSPPMSLSSLQ